MVVQRLCSFQLERRVVPWWALPQPLPGWGLLGRVQRRSVLSEESYHDDTTSCKHLPLTRQSFKPEKILGNISNKGIPFLYHKHILDSLFILHFFLLDALLYIHNVMSGCKGSCNDTTEFFVPLTDIGYLTLSCLGCYVRNQISILINRYYK